ncbi:MAG: nickel transporter permease subunit NikB, partial [Firmicutes bacterium]|nr:nickel transporter permease subunit NikB [Bacillota bacterium]
MRRYILQRFLAIFPILIGISFFAFFLINIGPSDPAEVALRVNETV